MNFFIFFAHHVKVLALRSAHEQLLQLLSPSEQEELGVADSFAPFRGVNALHVNLYTQPVWTAATAQYHRSMAAAEKRIASKLRVQLQGLHAQSYQVRAILRSADLGLKGGGGGGTRDLSAWSEISMPVSLLDHFPCPQAVTCSKIRHAPYNVSK